MAKTISKIVSFGRLLIQCVLRKKNVLLHGIRMFVCCRMLVVCIRMLVVCIRIFRVLLICYPYVTRMLLAVLLWCFSYDPLKMLASGIGIV